MEFADSGDLFDPEFAVADGCLAGTQTGDRALVYQTGAERRGIGGLFDFSSDVMRTRDGATSLQGCFSP